jgi:hypothetical protein
VARSDLDLPIVVGNRYRLYCIFTRRVDWIDEVSVGLKKLEKALLILIGLYFLVLLDLFVNGLALLTRNQTMLVFYFFILLAILVLLPLAERR